MRPTQATVTTATWIAEATVFRARHLIQEDNAPPCEEGTGYTPGTQPHSRNGMVQWLYRRRKALCRERRRRVMKIHHRPCPSAHRARVTPGTERAVCHKESRAWCAAAAGMAIDKTGEVRGYDRVNILCGRKRENRPHASCCRHVTTRSNNATCRSSEATKHRGAYQRRRLPANPRSVAMNYDMEALATFAQCRSDNGRAQYRMPLPSVVPQRLVTARFTGQRQATRSGAGSGIRHGRWHAAASPSASPPL